ncbi:PAAR domain-containing protein [Bosea sp. (in: a-proteobacteria)]|uniref:PAAR domain-containing protein n=1 Tax=Bosea sp. (in: a-proteobacteria) TaxID=1871050 RepID=UPI001AD3677B|nr:PAAR domain-containing protein [Bosea sp. (in: a-proteobacteria)]
MPGIALVGVDTAGGLQLGLQAPGFRVNGHPVVVRGDIIAPHGLPPHAPSPVMQQGSSNWMINGIPACREGHLASCGHSTTGQSSFKIP